MNFTIKKFFTFSLLACFLSFSLFAGDYQIENQPKALEMAACLEHHGVLKQKDNGYLYVEVPNEYISALLPLIECPGKIVPPRHFTSKKGIGAHISVMYENERIDHEIWDVAELGEVFPFQIKEIRTVKITRDNKTKKLWLLALDASCLETLRETYGLSNKLKGHDFHITIGTQLPTPQSSCQIEWFVDLEETDEQILEEAA